MSPCPACGHENEEGIAFCVQCGHDYTADTKTTEVDRETPEQGADDGSSEPAKEENESQDGEDEESRSQDSDGEENQPQDGDDVLQEFENDNAPESAPPTTTNPPLDEVGETVDPDPDPMNEDHGSDDVPIAEEHHETDAPDSDSQGGVETNESAAGEEHEAHQDRDSADGDESEMAEGTAETGDAEDAEEPEGQDEGEEGADHNETGAFGEEHESGSEDQGQDDGSSLDLGGASQSADDLNAGPVKGDEFLSGSTPSQVPDPITQDHDAQSVNDADFDTSAVGLSNPLAGLPSPPRGGPVSPLQYGDSGESSFGHRWWLNPETAAAANQKNTLLQNDDYANAGDDLTDTTGLRPAHVPGRAAVELDRRRFDELPTIAEQEGGNGLRLLLIVLVIGGIIAAAALL